MPKSWIAILALQAAIFPHSLADDLPPFVSISIVTQLKEEGVLGSEINVIKFACVDGSCWMDTIVLNRCVFGKQMPISFHATSGDTVNDTLRVTLEGDTLLVDEDNRRDTRAKYQFHLAESRSAADYIQTQDVTGFFGHYIKDSEIVGREILVEYVRLADYPIGVELACPIEYILQ